LHHPDHHLPPPLPLSQPDGVQRGLIGEIISRFEKKGFKLQAMKLYTPPRELLEQHYADLSSKGFFKGLIEYMSSGPVCCMVWEGLGAVKTGRVMLGATKPADSAPGTIRGDYAIDVGRNICHGSDSVENAEREVALWFPEGVNNWISHRYGWFSCLLVVDVTFVDHFPPCFLCRIAPHRHISPLLCSFFCLFQQPVGLRELSACPRSVPCRGVLSALCCLVVY